MHIGMLSPLHRPERDLVDDPVVFHLVELALRLRAAGHQITWLGEPGGPRVDRAAFARDPAGEYARAVVGLDALGVEVLHDATGVGFVADRLPRVRMAEGVGVALHAVATERWPGRPRLQTDRLAWVGGLEPDCGVLVALEIARAMKRSLLAAGPIRDEAWYARAVRPQLGADFWHLGPIKRADYADMLGCSAALVYADERPRSARPAICMSIASGTPVAAIATPDLIGWFDPAFGALTSASALAHGVHTALLTDRIACLTRARTLFRAEHHAGEWLARYARAIAQRA